MSYINTYIWNLEKWYRWTYVQWRNRGADIENFVNKGPSSQGYGFFSGYVWMWELDCEESWVSKNWCFWTVELEKTLESPLDCKEIKLVNPKGDQSWIFIGRTDAEAEAPILWPSWCKELTHWKRTWCWERLKAKEVEGGREWDG